MCRRISGGSWRSWRSRPGADPRLRSGGELLAAVVPALHVLRPFVVLPPSHLALGLKQGPAERPPRWLKQHHARFSGRAVALVHVAAQAGGGHVVPAVAAAAAAGHHMIDGEAFAFAAAVLAAVAVALEQVAAGERQRPEGHPHELAQSDHRGPMQAGAQLQIRRVLEPFRLPFQHHHSGAPPARDVERLVGGVENQHVAHGRGTLAALELLAMLRAFIWNAMHPRLRFLRRHAG